MKNVLIIRRRKLGRTSCKEIAAKMGHKAVVHRNDKPYPKIPVDLVIRWGCTSNVESKNVLNTAEAIHQVNDKVAFRKLCEGHDVCPKTWFDVDTFKEEADYNADGNLVIPVIGRPRQHAQGRNLHFCTELHEVVNIDWRYDEGNYYISEFIPKVAEYRVFVVGGRVACVAKKTPANPEDIAWNVAQGGRFDNVEWNDWPISAVETAVKAFNLTKLDFGGVDVMVDKDKKAYVLEINSAPSLTSEYRQTCMAKCLGYLAEHGKERIATKKLDKNRYRGYIHPAISEKAEV